jgi:hypothetical protein
MPTRSSRNRGAILIVVLGVLAVLALLGTTFATLQNTERHVARNYSDTVRAKMLAMSGVQDAVARLGSLSHGFNDPAMVYWGNNLEERGSPDWRTPLDRAQNPSYAYEDEAIQNPTDANVKPLVLDIDGVRIGFSGVLSNGTYVRHGDIYRLRVSDCNSLIHVNDGLEGGKDGNTSRNLKRILNTLGDLLGVRDAGETLLRKRPAGGYFAKRQVEEALGPTDAPKILPFVTTRAWVDPGVANPVPISRETLASYPIRYNEKLGIFRYGRSYGTGATPLSTWPLKFAPDHADPQGVEHAVFALDELNPQYIEMTRRAPLNVNLAPREILTSVIAGLQGVFLVERRKSNPHPWNLYSFMVHPRYKNGPGGPRGDEFGYLYSTLPFAGPRATVAGGIDASKVADEIIACRTKSKSPSCGLDYAKVWYGGSFRSWRQFNAFCDGLVTGGLLRDERPIYYDFQPSSKGGGSMTGPDHLIPSRIQPEFAAQALADVLKANFNPNFTSNKINPDANLFTIVDKTDLITCSTEFCFTPMGIFEIESDGMVVNTAGSDDLLRVRQGQMVARKKIVSIVKVYDIHRETSQADFSGGTSSDAAAGAATDNGKSLVTGPEPDVGKIASECAYSGWIQLSTIGGPAGHAGPQLNSVAHGHFSKNHDLHHHAGGAPKVLRPVGGPYFNNRDRTESLPGPYDPDFGGPGRHRLARGWRAEDPPKEADYTAVSDLRIDGAYVERDSALLYENSAAVFGMVGTVAYWIKPSYAPEMTGKPRTYFCLDQAFRQRQPAELVQLIHGQWFFASHDTEANTASPNELVPLTYSSGPWVPMSMAAGFSTHERYGGGVGKTTPSLNHRGHADSQKEDLLRRNGWIHVAYMWDMTKHEVTLLINGQALPQTRAVKVHPQNFNSVQDFIQAPLRIGEPSTTMSLTGRDSRNWSADSTIDEFYLWKGDHLAEAQELWSRGRYYVPRAGKEAVFTSRPLDLAPAHVRDLPTASGSATVASSPAAHQVRVLGASWTWYPEKHGKNGEPTAIDHHSHDPLASRVHMTMLLNHQPVGDPLQNEAGSPIRALFVNPGDVLNYRLHVGLPDAELDSILLGTPVIDDVTIYYTAGTKYLYYELYGASP